jgi:predicted kinase
MDIDARGRSDLGYYFTERYQARTGDDQLFDLLPFYRCYRAYVRGKVLSFKLDEPEFSKTEREAAVARARSYFHLARRYAAPLNKPTVIIVAGLSGTGKTSLARAIAGEMGLRVISADAVRKSIFEMGSTQYQYGEGPYSSEANRLTYEKMIEMGKSSLDRYGGVVLDATFRRASDCVMARDMASKVGANLRFIECKLSPESIRVRLEKRTLLKEGLSDATWTTYSHQRNEFEPLVDLPSGWHLAVDTAGTLSITSHSVCDWLRESDRTDYPSPRHSTTS